MKQNRYYLFFDSQERFDKELMLQSELTLLAFYHLELCENDLCRLFFDICSKQLNGKEIIMAVVTSNSDGIESGNCLSVEKYLERSGCMGSSSIKKNRKIEALLNMGDIENGGFVSAIRGSKGWETLEEYFSALKQAQVSYVVLRKYENLPEKFVEGDKDLDVLCFDHDEFVSFSNADKRSIGISGYRIKVSGEWLSLDVRFVGDNYYDPNWAREMLRNRELYHGCVYVMDKDNYFYSILYHVMTQKKSISKYYIDLISKMEKDMCNQRVEEQPKSFILEQLYMFMENNRYSYVKPLDSSVIQNRKAINALKKISYYPSKGKLRWIEIAARLRNCPKSLYDRINKMR